MQGTGWAPLVVRNGPEMGAFGCVPHNAFQYSCFEIYMMAPEYMRNTAEYSRNLHDVPGIQSKST